MKSTHIKKTKKKKTYKVKKPKNDKDEGILLDENTKEVEENEIVQDVKIAKYWSGSNLIEVKNTNGDIFHIESENIILSLSNGKLLALDEESLKIVKEFYMENEEILSFSYNERKNEVICLMSISMFRIFDFESEKCINQFKMNKTVGKIVKIDPSGNFIAIATSMNSILIYDTNKFNLECVLIGHRGIIYDIAFNPLKDKFILYSASEDNSVKVWNILLKKCTSTLQPHTNSVRHLSLTNDGSFLISGTFDNKIFIWKLSDIYSTDLPKPKIYCISFTFESMLYFTKISKEKLLPSLLLGSDDGIIHEFNLQTGEFTQSFSIKISQPIIQLSYSTMSNRLFVLTIEQILVYVDVNLVSQKIDNCYISKVYPCYCQEILSVKYINNNSNNFLFASNDSLLKYYDVDKSNIIMFEGHSDFIMNITVKNDLIATSSKDNTIRIWKWYKDEKDIFQCKSIFILKGHSEAVNCASIAIKKNKIIVSGCKDGSIKLWDINSIFNIDKDIKDIKEINESKYSQVAHEDEVNVIKFSPNEKIIASGSYDKTIKIFNTTLNLLSTIKGHKRGITDLSFSPYAKILVSSSTDKTIKIWNLNDYSCLNTFNGHLSSVLQVEWIYHGTHIISSGVDGLVKFWNIKSSECINTIDAHEGKIWAIDVNFKEDKLKFISGGTDAKIVIWEDVTAQKETELEKEKEEKYNKEDDLRMMNYKGNFIAAMKLSIELKHKGNFISAFENYVNSVINREINIEKMSDEVDLIIENRKVVDKEIEIDENKKVEAYIKGLNEIFANKEIKTMIENNMEMIIEIIRDYNIKLQSFLYSQILLKFMLKITKTESFYYNRNNSRDIQDENLFSTKKRKRTIPKNYIENLEVVKMYSEKHLERMMRELTKSYMIDFSIQKIKLV